MSGATSGAVNPHIAEFIIGRAFATRWLMRATGLPPYFNLIASLLKSAFAISRS
jgi:hypothetical protein